MIAVVIADDGLHFKVHANADDGTVIDVTSEYEIHPMAIELDDGSSVAGFHVGKRLPRDQKEI